MFKKFKKFLWNLNDIIVYPNSLNFLNKEYFDELEFQELGYVNDFGRNSIVIYESKDWFYFPLNDTYLNKHSILFARSFVKFDDKCYFNINNLPEIPLKYGQKYLEVLLIDGIVVNIPINVILPEIFIEYQINPLCSKNILKNNKYRPECSLIANQMYRNYIRTIDKTSLENDRVIGEQISQSIENVVGDKSRR